MSSCIEMSSGHNWDENGECTYCGALHPHIMTDVKIAQIMDQVVRLHKYQEDLEEIRLLYPNKKHMSQMILYVNAILKRIQEEIAK